MKDLKNYDHLNVGDESVIIESICSLVSVNLSLRAFSMIFASLLWPDGAGGFSFSFSDDNFGPLLLFASFLFLSSVIIGAVD